jgi:hypothetical protein
MTTNIARKLALAFTLAALLAPIGQAVAESTPTQPAATSGTDPEPTVARPAATSGTDPEPTVVETILTFFYLA